MANQAKFSASWTTASRSATSTPTTSADRHGYRSQPLAGVDW